MLRLKVLYFDCTEKAENELGMNCLKITIVVFT